MAHGAWRAVALVALAAGVLATPPGDAAAQSSTRARLAAVERDRSAATAEAARLRARAAAAQSEIAALDARLVAAGRRRSQAEAAQADAERRLQALRAQAAVESVRHTRAQDALTSALIMAALTQHRPDQDALHAGVFARSAAPVFQTEINDSARALAEARALDQRIAAEETALAAA